MAVWDELTGQSEAIAVFRAAVDEALGASPEVPDDLAPAASAMTHSWLITGPAGSGRSNLAYAFAVALLGGEADDAVSRQVAARTHPDLGVLGTDGVVIKMADVQKFVAASYYSPSVSRYRVMVIEDADRMTERTSNVLLKALEEPPPRTVWILCAPSEADLLPTIRSRVRTVHLRIPAATDVAELLVRRNGIEPEDALRAAREAQSHIGMARRLATDAHARQRRERTLELALGIHSTADAVLAAAGLLELAGDDAKTITAEKDAEERDSALRALGIEPGGTIPPALRGQLRAMEEDQKRRATRSLRDGIDRILVDLLSLYRDVLLLQLGASAEPVNLAIRSELERAGNSCPPTATLQTLDAIATARRRIEGNVSPLLALEAMLIRAVRSA